ncbi:MAG: RNA polymerase sigma factor [Pseudodesulfovibrio sp.]|jgi:RNA polymerase sigma-70 factor (ECF subfamily)|uniref:RNA polymerase n=1 Tax=Pseudodesulfovibrio indicus TaxID=1716143 RepID=A0A126QL36_9BACT|nr:RNA polymerase sigma factor [Pseudodesulfovibrio indicus]AMK10763.1 RNA polymerase [Pseudodesulfovibrio indicus]TDT91748.1 RNA polymerase sigma-70 factor (ECF subfamily) [Pseudodesulfovibrio indicus]
MAGQLEDVQVIERVLDGDRDAFALLLQRHEAHVARLVSAHVPAGQSAEVAHEAFIRAFRGLPSYRPVKPFRNWLTTIALRCCKDYWRREYRNREAPVSDLSEDGQRWLDTALASDSRETFETQVRQREYREILNAVLARLAPLDRMVLTLSYIEERTTGETAEMLGISVPNVKVRAFRAKRKLKGFLKRYGIQGEEHEA